MFVKGVRVFHLETSEDSFFAVNGCGLVLEIIEGSDIVKSSGVVLVLMCQKYGIKVLYTVGEGLVPEIRSAVYQKLEAFIFHKC